jgi:hypothetical protein
MFLVADSQIAAMLKGFLGRSQCHRSLGCGPFAFEPALDLVVDPTRDPGVYTRGFEVLATYTGSHRRAVVVLDAAWEGSPGADRIRAKITEDLKVRWKEYLVVVLDPELEAWIWQDNQHVATALGVQSFSALRDDLEAAEFWRAGEPKPFKPKEAVEYALRRARIPRSSAVYQQIASRVSTRDCIDPAFRSLCDGLQAWFGDTA